MDNLLGLENIPPSLTECSITYSQKGSRILTHYFNQKVDIVIPCNIDASSSFSIANHPSFSMLKNVSEFLDILIPLSALVTSDFMSRFPSAYGISIDAPLDQGNACCLLPDQTFVLSLDKDTYEELGMSARKAKFPLRGERWIVELDLGAFSFQPGGKLYERVKWCLDGRLSDVRMYIGLANGESPSKFDELEQYFKEYPVKRVRDCALETHVYGDVPLPTFNEVSSLLQLSDMTKRKNFTEEQKFYLSEINSWFGAVHLGLDSYLTPIEGDSEFVSEFTHTFEISHGAVSCISCEGLIAFSDVVEKIETLSDFVEEGYLPWAAVTVWGFKDACVNWKSQEHWFVRYGENDVTIIVFPNQKNITLKTVEKFNK